jgi:8-oxo-dGTP pyrophosphatase MutT (NUDIX family)
MSSTIATPASTLLLVRDAAAGPLEVLMVERHAKMGFAGGALVFPGGKVDPADRDPAWGDLCDGADGLEPDDLAARIAAIRETFEEAGVLVARARATRGRGGPMMDAARAGALAELRFAVDAKPALFVEMIAREGLVLALDALVPYARWVPPEGLHKRFDTWFFIAAAPPGQAARQDGAEATTTVWTTAAAALAARDGGRAKIIFPTARNLELLGVTDRVDAALAAAAARPRDIVQPAIVSEDGALWLTIPGHLGHPILRERMDSAMKD